MKIAIFSDVHGNLTALEAVLAAIEADGPDLTLFAGDLCLFGPRPADCVDRLQQSDVAAVYGNTDQWLSNRPLLSDDIKAEKKERRRDIDDIIDWTSSQLGPTRRAWLRTLPFQRRVSPSVNPRDDLFVVHANPQDVDQAIYPPPAQQETIYGEVKQPDDAPELAHLLGDFTGGVLAFGHVHVPNVRQWGELTLANISSVSLAHDGDTRAKYGWLTWQEGDGWTIEQRHVAYDLAPELALLAERQPPGWESLQTKLENGRP